MRAAILSIGDELVLGQTVDTNSAWLSQQLAAVGCDVAAHVTVGDDQPGIEQAIKSLSRQGDVLLISGGLGPTDDDLTRQALAAVMGVELVLDEAWLAKLKAFFDRVGRQMPQSNTVQAMVPRGAKMIDNPNGTACGLEVTLGTPPAPAPVPIEQLQGRPIGRVLERMGKVTREQVDAALVEQKRINGAVPFGQILIAAGTIAEQDLIVALAAQKGIGAARSVPSVTVNTPTPSTPGGTTASAESYEQMFGLPKQVTVSGHACRVFVMPGVPKEMKAMFAAAVLPHVRAAGGGATILQRTLHTFGLGESTVAERVGALMKRGRNPSVGTTVSGGVVSLRINARFPSVAEAERELAAAETACRTALGDVIYGQDGTSLAEVVGQLLKWHPGVTVATAESCTGGLLAKVLTDVPGSSAYFRYGWVTYANEAKQDLLGVPADVLAAHGAVSEPVVAAMATDARRRASATYAVAISGVAGPDGGTPEKPVGTVCLALAGPDGPAAARTFHFPGDREMIRDRSAKMALTMLRYALVGKPMPF